VTALPLAGAAAVTVSVAVLVGAIAQAVTGFGFSLVCAPVLVVALGARPAVALVNLLAIFVNLSLLLRERSGIRLADSARLFVPAAIVTPVAAFVVHRTDPAVLSVVAGVLIAASAWALAAGLQAARLRGAGGAAIAGVVSAAMNTAGGVGGPAAAMYATNAAWPPASLRPTLQVYFLGLNVVTVIALGPVRPRTAVVAALLAALIVGLVAGSLLADRLPVRSVRWAILALSFAGGLVAVGRGLFG
jgi:uncharacterized membrane protein YfcA